MSEKPPVEIWTLAQSHDVKLVPTAGLPKYVLAESAEKRIAELDHTLRESQEQTRVQAVVYEGRERRDKPRIAELEAQVTNQISTIEGLKNMDAMTCGCKYNKVWMGTKWEHYFVGCKEHGKGKIAELEAELAKARETARDLLEALIGLVDQITACENDSRYISVWTIYYLHGGRYEGPFYIEEMNKAKDAIARAKAGEKFL
jgi:hypothetical protein